MASLVGPPLARPAAIAERESFGRVAIIHDWLVTYSGAERVLEQLLLVFPDADVFTIVDFLPEADRAFLGRAQVTTSFVQHLPRAARRYRSYLPLMPLAVEQWDLSGYDLVISSSWAVAKGVITGPDQLHICICHTPIRYAWDLQHVYLREARLVRGARAMLARYLLHRLRVWDVRTAHGVDSFVAVSEYIARRIRKAYGRDAAVIHSPVDVEFFTPGARREDYYVTASRFVPYKRVDLIVEAFSRMPGRRLVVIGDGPDFARAQAKAAPNVELLGYQPAEVLRDHLRRARAFVFAAEEDFGIAPVEAQACGTPVIAYGRGGVRETIRGLDDSETPTGVFFDAQTVASLTAAVSRFERTEDDFDADACRRNALRFSCQRYRAAIRAHVESEMERAGSATRARAVVPVAAD